MKTVMLFLKRLICPVFSFIRRMFHGKTNFEKLLSNYKETKMDITTLTQLIDAFRAETAQDAITPDSLGQLLQKIVNLLGDAADSSVVETLNTWRENLTSARSLIKDIRLTSDSSSVTFVIDKVNASTGEAYTDSLRINYPAYKIANGAANGFYMLSLTNETGDVVYSQVKIYGASSSLAGIMTAEDKRKLDNTAAGLNSLADEVALKATKDELEQVTSWQDNIKDIGSVVKSATVQSDGADMHLILTKADTDTGQLSSDNLLVPHATSQRAGVMTAADKTKLENVASGLNSLADEVELKATKLELEQVTEWQDKVMEVGAAVKTAAVGLDGEKMYLRLTKGSLVDGSSRTDNILIPHATERTAGVMSAEDYASLQTLVEQSGQGDEEEQTADVYRITAEPKGNRLFVNYPNELSVKGYVPYLYRHSVRRTHFGRTQSGGNDRIHGERRKGWHRNYDDQRLKVGTNYEILIGRLTNPGQDVPHWDYLDNGPRELFGVIHDLSDGTGRWIGYRFMFGLKQFCFYPESSTHRFTFGIAFGPPLTETKKKIYPHEMVTNIAPFHVEVKFDPDDQQGPQEAPELNFRFCI